MQVEQAINVKDILFWLVENLKLEDAKWSKIIAGIEIKVVVFIQEQTLHVWKFEWQAWWVDWSNAGV